MGSRTDESRHIDRRKCRHNGRARHYSARSTWSIDADESRKLREVVSRIKKSHSSAGGRQDDIYTSVTRGLKYFASKVDAAGVEYPCPVYTIVREDACFKVTGRRHKYLSAE